MSGEANDLQVDIEGILNPECHDECGVPAGGALLSFVSSVLNHGGDREKARARLVDEVGHDGVVETAATISAFVGLVRIADGTGIVLDDGALKFSSDMRQNYGLNKFAGAINSDISKTATGSTPSIKGLFS